MNMTNRIALPLSVLALAVAAAAPSVAGALVNGASIKNHTITAAKLTPAAQKFLRGRDGIDGAPGAPGAPGTPGPVGPTGSFDPSKVQYVTGVAINVPPYPYSGFVSTVTALCPAGTKAIAGGYYASITMPAASRPNPDGSGWSVIVSNTTSITATGVVAYAVCGGSAPV